jgi:alpha-glucosidase
MKAGQPHIDYMDGYRNFIWNSETFPNASEMLQKLHAQGLHLVTILDPGTKIDEGYSVYRDGTQKDYFCRFQDGESFVGSVWLGDCVFPDFSRTEVRAWWGSPYQDLLNQGVDGIWNDMNEPSLTRFFAHAADEPPLAENTMRGDVLHRAGRRRPPFGAVPSRSTGRACRTHVSRSILALPPSADSRPRPSRGDARTEL